MKIIFISFLILLVLMAMVLIMQMTQKKMVCQLEKWSQIECGFSNMTPSHIPFSFQFFLISILFLIFDIEIALILSYPLEVSSFKNEFNIYFFLIVLSMGLLYEWQKGKINWNQ